MYENSTIGKTASREIDVISGFVWDATVEHSILKNIDAPAKDSVSSKKHEMSRLRLFMVHTSIQDRDANPKN